MSDIDNFLLSQNIWMMNSAIQAARDHEHAKSVRLALERWRRQEAFRAECRARELDELGDDLTL